MYLVKIYKDSSKIDGMGIFAGEFVPEGTIIYYHSNEDNYLLKTEFLSLSDDEKEKIYKFGVEDEAGNWVVTDGDANHSCDANILSLFVDGIYCDIAAKDIQAGEEITIDYGLFYSSFQWTMMCKCSSPHCRGVVGSGLLVDSQTQEMWRSRISRAAGHIFDVRQPLFSRGDECAMRLASAIRSKRDPKIFPYIKFSLIS